MLKRTDGVITTNYDPIALEVLRELEAEGVVLHEFHANAKEKCEEEVKSLIHSISTTPAIRSKEKFIVFLHGKADFTSSDDSSEVWKNVVMTFRQYAEAYMGHETPDSPGLNISGLLKTVLSSCNVTLLGYSLSDYVIALLFIQSAQTDNKNHSHYLIFNTREGGQPSGDSTAKQKYSLPTTYPSMAYLRKIDDLYGLQLIPLEAVAKTDRYAGLADTSAMIPTLNDGMNSVLSELSQAASKQEKLAAQTYFDELISEGEDSE